MMKKTYLTLLTTAFLSASSFVGADEGIQSETVLSEQTSNSHRLYAGPEFIWSHYKGHLDKNSINLDLSRNVYYGGLRFGYEFLQPDAFYAATDAVAALGAEKAKVCQENKTHPKFLDRAREVFRGNRGQFWSNIEQRFGYTFSSSLVPSCTVSVFAGPGFHYEHAKNNHAHWWYGAVGMKALQQFSEHFHLGCDLKTMYSFAATDNLFTRPTSLGKGGFWGYEVALPLQWTVGESKAFDVQLKPYLLKFNASSPETILGARVELGYNF
jgi:hypothetical protein